MGECSEKSHVTFAALWAFRSMPVVRTGIYIRTGIGIAEKGAPLVWRRASEIFADPHVFDGVIEPMDIKQPRSVQRELAM